jgi:hypothetical protein
VWVGLEASDSLDKSHRCVLHRVLNLCSAFCAMIKQLCSSATGVAVAVRGDGLDVVLLHEGHVRAQMCGIPCQHVHLVWCSLEEHTTSQCAHV